MNKFNNWKEKYPNDIQKLITKSLTIAKELEKALNNNCPILSNLYTKKDGKMHRQTSLFKDLKYTANVKSNKNVKDNNEFKGIYVFGEEIDGKIKPVYVGISRTAFRRLRQHGWGKVHNECTLAYNIVIDEFYKNKYEGKRIEIEEKKLTFGKEKVQNFKVALFPIEDDFDLYFLEVALAGYWKTKWNSFRTH